MLISSEEELVTSLTSCGFDFDSRVREIATRFPAKADWGVASFQILPFELRAPFAGFEPPLWKIPFFGELDLDLPPQRYRHEFQPTTDPKENHRRAVAHLSQLFGPGKPGIATNVYDRRWQVGFFKIQTITWPRELNRVGNNSFEGHNPYLWISANITIEPEFPFVARTEDATEPMQVLLNHSLEINSRVYARRNRFSSGRESLEAGLVQDAFVIRGPETSVRVPMSEIQRVKHTRVTPDRFPGSSNVELETLFLGHHKVTVPVARGAKTDSLDGIAREFARALSKPFTVIEYADEG